MHQCTETTKFCKWDIGQVHTSCNEVLPHVLTDTLAGASRLYHMYGHCRPQPIWETQEGRNLKEGAQVCLQ